MKKAAVLLIAFCMLFCAACQAPANNPTASGQPDGTSPAEGFMCRANMRSLTGRKKP